MESQIKLRIVESVDEIISQLSLDDASMSDQVRALITGTLEKKFSNLLIQTGSVGRTSSDAPKARTGQNGYTLFSKEHRKELDMKMGKDAAKKFFVEQGGVQVYIPALWNAMTEPEQDSWNEKAKQQRETDAPLTTAVVSKTNLWHEFQGSFAAYAKKNGSIGFEGLARASGAKYQELKKEGGDDAVRKFIVENPRLAKTKNKAPKKAVVSEVAVSI